MTDAIIGIVRLVKSEDHRPAGNGRGDSVRGSRFTFHHIGHAIVRTRSRPAKRKVNRLEHSFRLLAVLLLHSAAASCGYLQTGYFHDKINDATQEMVLEQYGVPHDQRSLANGGAIWTYYERGSTPDAYAGSASGASCRAYVLTFDAQNVLREWKQETCR